MQILAGSGRALSSNDFHLVRSVPDSRDAAGAPGLDDRHRGQRHGDRRARPAPPAQAPARRARDGAGLGLPGGRDARPQAGRRGEDAAHVRRGRAGALPRRSRSTASRRTPIATTSCAGCAASRVRRGGCTWCTASPRRRRACARWCRPSSAGASRSPPTARWCRSAPDRRVAGCRRAVAHHGAPRRRIPGDGSRGGAAIRAFRKAARRRVRGPGAHPCSSGTSFADDAKADETTRDDPSAVYVGRFGGRAMASEFGKVEVRALMTPVVQTLRRNDQLTLADDLMSAQRIRHLPVLDEEGLRVRRREPARPLPRRPGEGARLRHRRRSRRCTPCSW